MEHRHGESKSAWTLFAEFVTIYCALPLCTGEPYAYVVQLWQGMPVRHRPAATSWFVGQPL
jgi:hypothetical protein